MTNDTRSDADKLLLALYTVRQEQHPQLTEEEMEAGITQNELTVQVSKAMPILEIEDEDEFVEFVAEAVPALSRRGYVMDLWDQSTDGYIGGLKLTRAGIRRARELLDNN